MNNSNNYSEWIAPDNPWELLDVPYTIFELTVAIIAVVGNAMIVYVFFHEKKLRRRTNYYIMALAVADFLIGLLGIPFAVLSSIGLPTNLYACLITLSLLMVLCVISILCLLAVSIDRYWAILYPMEYSRTARTKTAIVIITICWITGSLIGFLPLMGWHKGGEEVNQLCLFTKIIDSNYLLFIFFSVIMTPSIFLIIFYTHIYFVIWRQIEKTEIFNPNSGERKSTSSNILRVFGPAQKKEVKATKNLAVIVFFFLICWLPLFAINVTQAFCSDCYVPLALINTCIALSHLNSAVNPFLYAYHLRDFRFALKNFIYNIFKIDRTNDNVTTTTERSNVNIELSKV